METPALVVVGERSVQHVHKAVVAAQQRVDQPAGDTAAALFGLDHEGGELARSVGVPPYLRDTDDASVVVGDETLPVELARVEPGPAHHRCDVVLVGLAGMADGGRHMASVAGAFVKPQKGHSEVRIRGARPGTA